MFMTKLQTKQEDLQSLLQTLHKGKSNVDRHSSTCLLFSHATRFSRVAVVCTTLLRQTATPRLLKDHESDLKIVSGVINK